MSKSLLKASIAALALAACGTGSVALADDSSMSMWTGDSYAYFNNLDYSAGKFNTARATHADPHEAMAKAGNGAAEKAQRPSLLAARPFRRGTPTNPFRNDTGA